MGDISEHRFNLLVFARKCNVDANRTYRDAGFDAFAGVMSRGADCVRFRSL
jgi:hypothetical protein